MRIPSTFSVKEDKGIKQRLCKDYSITCRISKSSKQKVRRMTNDLRTCESEVKLVFELVRLDWRSGQKNVHRAFVAIRLYPTQRGEMRQRRAYSTT